MTELEIQRIEKVLERQEELARKVFNKTGSVLPFIALQDQMEQFHNDLEKAKKWQQ